MLYFITGNKNKFEEAEESDSYKMVVLKNERDVVDLYSEKELNEGLIAHIEKDFRAARAGRRIICGVKKEGEVVGSAQLVFKMKGREGVADGKDTAFLHHGRVREDLRGEGIGTYMINSLNDEAKRRGFSRVLLSVLADNTSAIRLYNRLGFREVARMEAKNGKELIRMAKKL